MDEIEALLGQRRFLCGDRLTLSDVRLLTTLIRYDLVYFSHFKTSRNRIRELPNLHRFARDLCRIPAVKDSINVDHIKGHYFGCHLMINPTGIVPKGPPFDLFDPDPSLPPALAL